MSRIGKVYCIIHKLLLHYSSNYPCLLEIYFLNIVCVLGSKFYCWAGFVLECFWYYLPTSIGAWEMNSNEY